MRCFFYPNFRAKKKPSGGSGGGGAGGNAVIELTEANFDAMVLGSDEVRRRLFTVLKIRASSSAVPYVGVTMSLRSAHSYVVVML